MSHDFTIHYYKGKLNPADRPSHYPDYMDENEELDIMIARLMLILLNKLYLNKLGPKKLVTTSLEAGE